MVIPSQICKLQNLIFIWILFATFLFLQVVQKEREEKLAEILKGRLNQYVQGNKEEFTRHAEAEVARLSNAGNPFLYSSDRHFVSASAHLFISDVLSIMLFDNLQANQVYWEIKQVKSDAHFIMNIDL